MLTVREELFEVGGETELTGEEGLALALLRHAPPRPDTNLIENRLAELRERGLVGD